MIATKFKLHDEIVLAMKLRIPLDFDEAVKALLSTPPPRKGVTASRKGAAKKARNWKAAKTRGKGR